MAESIGMLNNLPSGCDSRPVVIDGEVVWLPTLVGLMNGTTPIRPSLGRSSLRTSVVAAVVANRMVEEFDTNLAADALVDAPHDLSGLADLESLARDARTTIEASRSH